MTTEPRSERVAIVGTRDPSPEILSLVNRCIKGLPTNVIVVSGKAVGVDRHAAASALRRGLRVREFPPDYERYTDRVAPLHRNAEIARYCDRMVAFPGPGSRGTWDCIRRTAALGKFVLVVTLGGAYPFSQDRAATDCVLSAKSRWRNDLA